MLSEFRSRLLEGKSEQKLLDILFQHYKGRGWINKRGQQRTDSTHVLGTVRVLNHLELVGETLRTGPQLELVGPIDCPPAGKLSRTMVMASAIFTLTSNFAGSLVPRASIPAVGNSVSRSPTVSIFT